VQEKMQKTNSTPKISQRFALVYGVFKMSRPMQLLAIILVYLYGSLVAWVHAVPVDLNAFGTGLLVVLLVSASIHLANEYADYKTDALTRRTPFSGGSGSLQDLNLSPRVALIAAWIAFIGGAPLAVIVYISGVLNPLALWILSLGAFLGWMYSLQPLALAWRGWGELDNAFLGGVALPLYAYVEQSSRLDLRAILIFIPFGMLVFINLLATTWADRKADAAVGKFTLATRWVKSRLKWLYFVVAAGAFLYLGGFNQLLFPQPVAAASLLVLPVVFWGFAVYTRQHSPFPTVAGMIVFLLVQIAAWAYIFVET
jgi:1,4-dihydroxy-2-naphthoate octaprenyltransferase